MTVCTNCKTTLSFDESYEYCPYCGHVLVKDPMCLACGGELPECRKDCPMFKVFPDTPSGT